MPVSFPILFQFFSCLQMYSDNGFDIYFHEVKMFFQFFVYKVYRSVFGENNCLITVQFSLTNLQVSWRSWF